MIKAELETEKTKEIEYPCIMKSDKSTLVILFTEFGKGLILNEATGAESFKVGEYVGNWDMEYFKPYNKKVVLYND